MACRLPSEWVREPRRHPVPSAGRCRVEGVERRPDRGAVGTLLRACHPEPTVAVTVMATALAAGTGRDPGGVVAAGLAVLAGQLSVGWHNDWFDADRDRRAGRDDKPLVAGERETQNRLWSDRRSLVGMAAVAALVACVPLSALSGWRAAAVHLAAVALAWGYNAGIKSTWWSWMPYAVSFALLVAFVTLGGPARSWPAWWALAAGALLGVGAHLVNAVPDLAGDAATGVRGLPQRLGRQRSVVGGIALLVGASIVVSAASGSPLWLVVSAPAAALALVVVIGAVGGRAALFRSALVVATIDVALLVARGHTL